MITLHRTQARLSLLASCSMASSAHCSILASGPCFLGLDFCLYRVPGLGCLGRTPDGGDARVTGGEHVVDYHGCAG